MSILCLDVGGSYIKTTVIDSSSIILIPKAPTPMDSLENFLAAIQDVYNTQKTVYSITGIALSMPGVIDEYSGYMHTGGSLKFIQELDLQALLSNICDNTPVHIVNDAKAGALAELEVGSLQKCKNAVMLTIGTAMGGAVIVDRNVITGNHHFAGEFSYLLVPDITDENKFMPWGTTGGSSRLSAIYASVSEKEGYVNSEHIFRMAENGDSIALQAIDAYCDSLIIPLYNLQCIIDPDTIAIGGGISEQPLFIDTLKKRVELYQKSKGSMEYGMPAMNVVKCTFVDNTMGAYLNYIKKENMKVGARS